MPVAVVACVLVLLLFAGCGEGSSTPTSVVRNYEKAIASRDGDGLCATFAPKLREVLAEQIMSQQAATGATGRPRFDCGAFYHLLIGYPHENVDRQFVAGKLIVVGGPRQVTRGGVVYVKVRAKFRIEFTYTGYSTRDGAKGSATIEDTVWLSKGKEGKWGVVKPSLGVRGRWAHQRLPLLQRRRTAQPNGGRGDPLYGRAVAFVADAGVAHPLLGRVPTDLTWSVNATATTGSDQVPNRAPGEYVVIRQSDGRAVRPGSG